MGSNGVDGLALAHSGSTTSRFVGDCYCRIDVTYRHTWHNVLGSPYDRFPLDAANVDQPL